ncbi:MAG: hypothetical protein AABX13_01895 [Nanoarchaeota archaeon]
MVHKGKRNDFSNNTVLVMLGLIVVAVVIGLIFYLEVLDEAKPKVIVNGGKAVGEVAITVIAPPTVESEETGEVAITVIKPPR